MSCLSGERQGPPENSDQSRQEPSDLRRVTPRGRIPDIRLIDSTFTIRDATPGDEDCILQLERKDGQVSRRPAALEVCLDDMEPDELLGRRVQLRVEESPIINGESNRPPTADDIEWVDLIVGLEPAPQTVGD